jgi:uncharacterized protein YbaR (Trm112 family)
MKPRLFQYLACPTCQGDLDVSVDLQQREEVVTGSLSCRGCGRLYPITRGVPRLLPPELSADKEVTASRFGWEWKYFVEMHEEHRDQFLDWVHPLGPEFFAGKVVLDAGCGIGRHARCAADFGAREVIAMDLSDAVDTAFANAGELSNVHVVQGDIYHPPFRLGPDRAAFDFAYSIGVLHHLPHPEGGFNSLLRAIRPGGTIFAWVYGQENNGVVHHFIDPLRRALTSKLPPRVLLALSWPMALVLHALVVGAYHPLRGSRLFRRLPSHAYIDSLAPFSFRQKWAIVFDHLTAPTAFYIPGDEFSEWFGRAGLEATEFSWRNENSWRGRGCLPLNKNLPVRG